MIVIHGISAAFCIFVIGLVSAGHIRVGLHVRKNMISGLAQASTLLVLVMTGLTLYYGSEDIREGVVLAHWMIGLALLPLFLLHASRKRKRLAPHHS